VLDLLARYPFAVRRDRDIAARLDMSTCEARVLAMQDSEEVEAWRSQLRKGSLELAVLLLLRQKRAYGLEIVDILNRHNLGISEGSIYPLLARLRNEKKVRTQWVDGSTGHAHKLYELTDRGRKACAAMIEAWCELSQGMERLMDWKG
jgi:PadR family transcriptional regulator, regulatory protein PadR